MRILASAAATTPGRKAKAKTDEALTGAPSGTHEIFDDESHVTPSHPPDETAMGQNPAFPPANTIIAEKTTFVLNAASQAIQLGAVNPLLTPIERL